MAKISISSRDDVCVALCEHDGRPRCGSRIWQNDTLFNCIVEEDNWINMKVCFHEISVKFLGWEQLVARGRAEQTLRTVQSWGNGPGLCMFFRKCTGNLQLGVSRGYTHKTGYQNDYSRTDTNMTCLHTSKPWTSNDAFMSKPRSVSHILACSAIFHLLNEQCKKAKKQTCFVCT